IKNLEAFSKFKIERIDIADRQSITQLCAAQRFPAVVHLAAQAGVRHSLADPHAYVDANITGFLNVLEGCRHAQCRHLVYASSSSVYGANTRVPFRASDNVDHPLSLYGATKKANELMAHAYSHLYALPTTGLRFFTVYGPWGRPDMAIFSFTKAILSGSPIDVYNYGRMKRDFTYVDDIIEGLVRIIDQPFVSGQGTGTVEAPYRIYNIGNNQAVDLLRFIQVLEDCLGRKAIMNLLPMQPGDM